MIVLAIISLFCLALTFVYGMFNTVVNPSKTFVIKIVEETRTRIGFAGTSTSETKQKKLNTGELRDLTDDEKRRRFMWFAIATVPPMLFIILFLITQ